MEFGEKNAKFPLRTQLKFYCPSGGFIRTGHFNQCFHVEMHCMQERSMVQIIEIVGKEELSKFFDGVSD